MLDAPKAAVLWTGGKDSCLALLAARERFDVRSLVTFVPDPPRPFLAHPQEAMRAQAAALGLPHRSLPVGSSCAEDYDRGIDQLAAEGIAVLVTGDMDRVDGQENWIVERARDVVSVERPLWQMDRAVALRSILGLGLQVVCTLARDDRFAPTIAGRRFDTELVDELLARHGVDGFDACGENGEYHTCVLFASGFDHALQLEGARVEASGEFSRLCFDAIR